MRKIGILFFFTFMLSIVQAQEVKFPVPLIPGDRFTIRNEYNGSPVDTLWLLKDSQLRRFIVRAMKQEIDSARAALLTEQVGLFRRKTEALQKINQLRTEGYEHYKKLWLKTDKELESAEIRAERNLKLGFAAGILVSAALVILIR